MFPPVYENLENRKHNLDNNNMATPQDRAILNSIINPLQPSIGEFIPTEEDTTDHDSAAKENDSLAVKEARDLVRQAVQLAENGKVEESLEIFDRVVEKAPQWASGYNNRAQALRLLGRNDDAMTDLNNAINLCKGEPNVLYQALNQRASLHRLMKREEEAKKDFEAAAKLGSQFAKQQLAVLNPYAALCNKMLHDVFQRLKQGECLEQQKN